MRYFGLVLVLLFTLLFQLPDAICSEKKISLDYTRIPHLDTAIYYYNLGVKEKTNHNDGYYVEKFLKFVGLPKGNPWCAAFVSYCIGVCENIVTKVKSAVALQCTNKYTFSEKDVRLHKKTVEPGFLSLWGKGNTPKGHIGIVYAWKDIQGEIIEGNAANKVDFNIRKLEPRNYFRIRKFTPIYYTDEIQQYINTLDIKWINNIRESLSNFALTR